MKAYLERARAHDEFMKTQKHEFEVGKRHLANMMGEPAESFENQENIDVRFCEKKDSAIIFNFCKFPGSNSLSVSIGSLRSTSQAHDEATRGSFSSKKSS